jgi:hypothetical protein
VLYQQLAPRVATAIAGIINDAAEDTDPDRRKFVENCLLKLSKKAPAAAADGDGGGAGALGGGSSSAGSVVRPKVTLDNLQEHLRERLVALLDRSAAAVENKKTEALEAKQQEREAKQLVRAEARASKQREAAELKQQKALKKQQGSRLTQSTQSRAGGSAPANKRRRTAVAPTEHAQHPELCPSDPDPEPPSGSDTDADDGEAGAKGGPESGSETDDGGGVVYEHCYAGSNGQLGPADAQKSTLPTEHSEGQAFVGFSSDDGD